LGGRIHTAKENTENLFAAGKDICLEVNAEKTNYNVLSRDQHAGQNNNKKTGNNSLKL
jgi:hypothetical protein